MPLKLLVRDDCGGCEDLQEALKEHIQNGAIKVVNVKTDEGRVAAETLKVAEVPFMYFEDNYGIYHRCTVKPREGFVDVECGEPTSSPPAQ